MKIKRYLAADIREALKQVRMEQGPDAVILSTGTIADQAEVIVAVDYEVAAWRESTLEAHPAAAAVARSGASSAAATATNDSARSFTDVLALQQQTATDRDGHSAVDSAVDAELRTLRRMLETQLSALAWNDLTRRAPLATEVLRELTEFGFSRDLVASIADALPQNIDLTRARRLALARLADGLTVTGDRWTETGGRVAFVGPAGAGKTTVLAKVAARWVMRHGPKSLAFIGADSTRFGAPETIAQLGRLLGTTAHLIDELSELPAVLGRLSARRLVLIDMPGISARDPRLPQLAADLDIRATGVEVALTLAASAQAGVVEETLQQYAVLAPSCCVLTKLDECSSLGGVLSGLMRTGLPLAYVSDGQGIPDDLRPARAIELVTLAVTLAERHGAVADEELLTRRFGRVANARA